MSVTLEETHLRALLKEAAREGARDALHELGLHDESAQKDVNDLRDLIRGWREVRHGIISTVTKWITTAILGLLALGAWSHWGTGK